MRFNPFKFILLFSIVFTFASCDWLDTITDEPSTNPCFVSLKFAANDTVEGLEDAKFTLEWDETLNDSVIVNLDSLPYNTDVTRVIPTFTFYSSSAATLYTDSMGVVKDTITLTGTDTINFDRSSMKIKNIAEDEVTEKTYPLKVNVHKVEPELYQWNKVVNNIYIHAGSSQKALLINDSIYFFVNSGLNNSLYKSPDGRKWSDRVILSELPGSAEIRNIVKFKTKLYLVSEGTKLYSSANGINWTSADFVTEDYIFVNMLYEFNSKLWAIVKVKSDNSYRFATSVDGVTWIIIGKIPENFPVGDYAALSFASRTNQPKMLIAGGVNAAGELLNNIWSSENGSYWVDFSRENQTLGSLAGISVVVYDDKLLLFGGADENREVVDNFYMVSIDEGLSWSAPDTTYNQLQQLIITPTASGPDTAYVNYEPRYLQTALVKDKEIILIGGRDRSRVYTDVWTGRLNRLSFLIQD